MRLRKTLQTLWAMPLLRSRWALVVGFAAVALFAVSCGGGSSDDFGLDLYQTDFSSPDELKNWVCHDSGKWEIKDGWLVGDARIPEQRSIIWLKKQFTEDVRIQFVAECLDKPGDLNCFICGNGKNYSGYEIIIGGFANEKIGVYKTVEDGDPITRQKLERDDFNLIKARAYDIKIKKSRGTFRVYLDDALVVSAADEENRIVDREHRYFGFSTFENVVRFRDLRIEQMK
jgi:hypothetical protein